MEKSLNVSGKEDLKDIYLDIANTFNIYHYDINISDLFAKGANVTCSTNTGRDMYGR